MNECAQKPSFASYQRDGLHREGCVALQDIDDSFEGTHDEQLLHLLAVLDLDQASYPLLWCDVSANGFCEWNTHECYCFTLSLLSIT
jgi:hypothetical protein